MGLVIRSTNVDERVFFMETGGVQFRRKEKKRKHGDTDMKILVLADAESKYLWDYFDKKN